MTVKVQKVDFVFSTHESEFKVVRAVESGVLKVKILENLVKTLIRTELIKLGAYDRWNPYLNDYQSNFLGLVAILDLFHHDSSLISKLKGFYRLRKKISLKDPAVDPNKYLSESYNLHQILMEKIKTASAPITEGFRTIALK